MKRLCLTLLFIFVFSAPAYAALSYTEAQIDTLLGIVNAGSATFTSIGGLTETNGGILYGTANNAYAWLAAGAQGILLMGNAVGPPSFLAAGTATYMMIAAGADDPVWSTPAAVRTNLGLDVTDSTDATTFVLLNDIVADTPLVPKTDAGITYDATTGIGTITGGWSVPAKAAGPQSGTMLEDSDNGSNFVGIGAPASVTNDLVLLIPGTADPLLGQIQTFAVPTSVTGSDGTARDSAQASWIYRQAAQDPVVGDPDDFYTAFTLANLYGGTHICSADGQADFPATATGMNFTIKNEGNFALILHPYSGDKIYLDMNDLTTDVTATCAEDALIYCQYRSANAWSCDTYNCVVTP